MCPGCGAYAPDIAPASDPAPVRTDASEATPVVRGAVVPDVWHDRSAAGDADSGTGSDTAPYAPAADVEDVPPARQQGRAARRRQLTRWKKNKRRAVVASAVALVGGGLSIATMDRQSNDRAQAATAPDHRSMAAAEGQASERDRPVPTPATPEDTHSPSRTPSQPHEQTQSATTSAPRQQSLAATPRTAPITPPQATASSPPPVTATPTQPRSTATSTGDTGPARSDTTAEQAPAPAPSTADDRAPDASPTPPALISTSPTEVCLLGLCLG
ncbi:hypothetical protein OHA75_16515 [Streptomyces coelicoflavus]